MSPQEATVANIICKRSQTVARHEDFVDKVVKGGCSYCNLEEHHVWRRDLTVFALPLTGNAFLSPSPEFKLVLL